jgi:hypothetical protein
MEIDFHHGINRIAANLAFADLPIRNEFPQERETGISVAIGLSCSASKCAVLQPHNQFHVGNSHRSRRDLGPVLVRGTIISPRGQLLYDLGKRGFNDLGRDGLALLQLLDSTQ